MKALNLIRFLLPPRPGRIHALNSPFDQEEFKLHTAQHWVARGKADIEEGVLIFRDPFRLAIVRQFEAQELTARGDAAYETMIDLERSAGERIGSVGVWAGRNSGTARVDCGPEHHTMQMRLKFRTPKKSK